MERKTHYRWLIVALLFLITVINYIDRSSIAYAIDLIEQEFHFGEDKAGLLLGAFGVGYLFTTLLGGIAVDNWGTKKTLFTAILFWSVASALTGIARGFVMVFFARTLLGLAEGPGFPGMTRAISDWLPEKERNRALSWALISVPISLAIGGPVATKLIALFSWRGAYFVLAVLALVWLPLWWWLFKDRPSQSKYVNQKELAYIEQKRHIESKLKLSSSPWKILLTNKTLLVNNWAFFVFGYYLFFFMSWLPSYLIKEYRLDLTQVGLFSTIPWTLAAILMWVVGTLSDKIFKKTHSLRLSRSYPILITQLLSALSIIPVFYTLNLYWALAFISLAVGFAMAANAAYYAVNIDIAPERAGTALGIMDAVFAISSFVAPSLTGLIISMTGHFEMAFVLLSLLALSSVILTFFYHNKE